MSLENIQLTISLFDNAENLKALVGYFSDRLSGKTINIMSG